MFTHKDIMCGGKADVKKEGRKKARHRVSIPTCPVSANTGLGLGGTPFEFPALSFTLLWMVTLLAPNTPNQRYLSPHWPWLVAIEGLREERVYPGIG